MLTAQKSNIPVVYNIGELWLADFENRDLWSKYWSHRPSNKLKRMFKRIVKKALSCLLSMDFNELETKNIIFISEFLKQECLKKGFHFEKAKVIHRGISKELFWSDRKKVKKDIRLLYVGRVIKDKGVHTIIEALDKLISVMRYTNVTLDLFGPIYDRAYFNFLKTEVGRRKLEKYITFYNKVSYEEMKNIYFSHDILIFPSICKEGLGLTLIEAMAAKLAIISTATGGNREFLINGVNSLIFAPEDSNELFSQLKKLIDNPKLREEIIVTAEKMVRDKFNLETTIDEEEEFLKSVVNT
jgi:glycosyltransferase involved in cell wall biosynthesis